MEPVLQKILIMIDYDLEDKLTAIANSRNSLLSLVGSTTEWTIC